MKKHRAGSVVARRDVWQLGWASFWVSQGGRRRCRTSRMTWCAGGRSARSYCGRQVGDWMRINLFQPNGYITWHHAWNSAFCPHNALLCCLWISEQTANLPYKIFFKTSNVIYHNLASYVISPKNVFCLIYFCNITKDDIVRTVYHLVIYMQSNKIHNVVLMSKFIQHLC